MMIEFFKEWRGVIVLAVALIFILAVVAVFMDTSSYAACHQSAQRFQPPLKWRWNPFGNGCELQLGGNWYPADMVKPSLTAP